MVGAFAQVALNALFPPQCMACNALVKNHGTVCQECFGQLHFITTPMCAHCGFPFEYDLGEGALCGECIDELPAYDSAYSAFIFDDTSKALLHKLKFEDQIHLARIFADWLMRHMPPVDVDMVMPVPLSRKRLFSRRYNQSALVAKQLAKRLEISYQPTMLRRIRHTTPQTGLTRAQRLDNVHGAFAISPAARASLHGKSILLLDDVMTTGATIEACTDALKKAGAGKVHVVTLARALHTQ